MEFQWIKSNKWKIDFKLNFTNMNPEIQKFLIGCLGYLFIWIAVDYKRTEECKFGIFTKEGLLQLILITLGGTIITNV